MPSSGELHRRLDALQAMGIGSSRRRGRVDWSLVTDAELDWLEALAMQAGTDADAGAIVASLSHGDQEWLEAIGARLGIALAAGKEA